MADIVGQSHCPDCGAIANVKRQSNGEKIYYEHCMHCKSLALNRTKENSPKVKARMTPGANSLGVFGEFPEKPTEIKEDKVLPDDGDPEIISQKTEITPEETEFFTPPPEAEEPDESAESEGIPAWLKIGGGLLLAAFGIKAANIYINQN